MYFPSQMGSLKSSDDADEVAGSRKLILSMQLSWAATFQRIFVIREWYYL